MNRVAFLATLGILLALALVAYLVTYLVMNWYNIRHHRPEREKFSKGMKFTGGFLLLMIIPMSFTVAAYNDYCTTGLSYAVVAGVFLVAGACSSYADDLNRAKRENDELKKNLEDKENDLKYWRDRYWELKGQVEANDAINNPENKL